MILIVGSPRSGTTWLAKLLDSHPVTLYRHEPDSVLPPLDIPAFVLEEEVPAYRARAAEYLGKIVDVRNIKANGSLPMFPKAFRGCLRQAAYRGCVYGVRLAALALGYRAFVRRVRVPDLIPDHARRDIQYVVKSVQSLNRSRLFLEADPRLKLLYIIRHPCGFVSSLLRGVRSGAMRANVFPDQLARLPEAAKYGLTEERIRGMALERQLACRWMLTNERTLNETRGMENWRLVFFEELCREPLTVTREVMAFCGLSWTAETEAFIRRLEALPERRERYYQVMRSPRIQAQKWKSEMTADQIGAVLELVGDSLPWKLYRERGLA
jgi:hypothetical protein